MSGGGRGSGGSGGGARVSTSSTSSSTMAPSSLIPSSTKKTIQHIKDITENHSEEEIYAVLKECFMDPNETVTKLLLLDTFHEVKRKRDKKKDNAYKESGESRWKLPAAPIRGNHAVRPGFLARNALADSGGRNAVTGRDNGGSQAGEKGMFKEKKDVAPTASSISTMANGTSLTVEKNVSTVQDLSTVNGAIKLDASAAPSNMNAGNEVHESYVDLDALSKPTFDNTPPDVDIDSGTLSTANISAVSSTVCFSTADPVLLPSHDFRVLGVVGTIKREIGNHRGSIEPNAGPIMEKPGKFSNKAQTYSKLHESPQFISASIHSNPSVSRHSPNYGSRSQLLGPQKAGGNKEWKPKPAASTLAQGVTAASSSESCDSSSDNNAVSHPALNSLVDEASEIQKKIEDLHLPPRQHVIIPQHIHVPESERTKLSFGSFDASFGITTNYTSAEEGEKNSTPPSELSQVEERADEQSLSNQNVSEVSEDVVYSESAQNLVMVSGSLSGASVPSFENSDSQGHETSHLPNLIVQQPFDPASYYSQYYRSADNDGRISPLPSVGLAAKYPGGVAVLPLHAPQSPQEGGNALPITTAASATAVTQATGFVQSSVAMNQPPLPVFRPPTGLHISHYPPNYIPYGHYFSPFYVPSPGIHQILGNGSFSQQPQAGNLYPAPPAPAAPGMKYSFSQYKPGTNAGNSTQPTLPSGYAPYGSSANGYNQNSASTGGTTPTNDDLGLSQFKENCVYMTGQQSEGSPLWIAAPGRDMSSLPANSFYNIAPQGQHVAFAPAQVGHGAFTNIYHPPQGVAAAAVHPLLQQSQAMGGAVDMVGTASSVYQQPQHQQQMNWPSNY